MSKAAYQQSHLANEKLMIQLAFVLVNINLLFKKCSVIITG